MSVQLALKLGKYFCDGFGGASRCGYEGMTCGTRPAQVRVSRVDDALGIGEIVDSGHRAVFDTNLFVHDFNNWCEAIGGA